MDSAMTIRKKLVNPYLALVGFQTQAAGDTGHLAGFPFHLSDIFGPVFGVLLPTLILVFVATAVYAWARHRNRRQEPSRFEGRVPQPRRAHTQADTPEASALEALEFALYKRADTAIRDYYASIACLMLQYLGEKYQIKVHETTTAKILADVAAALTDSQLDYIGEILHTCDMVQLTRHHPTRSEQDDIYETARDFLEGQAKGL